MTTARRLRALLAILALTAALVVAGSAAAAQTKRIVGGTAADPADWPFAAVVYDHHHFICSGSVIAPRAVLTAGHCLPGGYSNGYKVLVGTVNRQDGSGEKIRVKRGKVDPKYLIRGHDDFAVLKLEEAAGVTPVELPTAAEADAATPSGATLHTAGWGATEPDGSHASPVLLEADTMVVGGGDCHDAFDWYVSKSEICTRGAPLPGGGETTACYGDSGGPLTADTPGGVRIVGTTSYGGNKCGAHKPTVFARISDGLDFIRDAAGL